MYCIYIYFFILFYIMYNIHVVKRFRAHCGFYAIENKLLLLLLIMRSTTEPPRPTGVCVHTCIGIDGANKSEWIWYLWDGRWGQRHRCPVTIRPCHHHRFLVTTGYLHRVTVLVGRVMGRWWQRRHWVTLLLWPLQCQEDIRVRGWRHRLRPGRRAEGWCCGGNGGCQTGRD